MSDFSKKLRELREKRGLTLDDFEKLGIKKGTMSNYELGKTEPKLETLIELSNFFGVSLDELICESKTNCTFSHTQDDSQNSDGDFVRCKGSDNNLDKQENSTFFEKKSADRRDDAPTPEQNPATTPPKAVRASSPKEGIPLIPIDAMAGFASGGEEHIMEYECERYIVPMFKGANVLIQVKGSSMIPKYNSGDVVACKYLPLTDIFFQWNKVYVLDTAQGALIKRVKPGADKEHIILVSDNEKYDPFPLRLDQIHALALVIGVIRLE